MANPNLLTATSVRGNTVIAQQAAGAVPTNLAVNAAGSGQILKINRVSVSNTSGSAVTISLLLDGSIAVFYQSVAATTTVNAITKDSQLYVLEGSTLTGVSVNINTTYSCSYDIIS
jgi:hypothetical protein